MPKTMIVVFNLVMLILYFTGYLDKIMDWLKGWR